MSRIKTTFEDLRSSGRKGFIPFVTAGDPTLNISEQIVRKLVDVGADIIELGVPFSDPMADGPTIQRSSQRALANGTRLRDVLSLGRRIRQTTQVPIVLFSYLNPLISYELKRLASDAADIGIDGVLITDAVDREADELRRTLSETGIDLISLIAPTTSDERLRMICERAQGFIYAVSRSGVTGARSDTSLTAETLVWRARRYTDLPIAVGFGISTTTQVEDVWSYADAAVIGSAIVAEIERLQGSPTLSDDIAGFVRELLPTFAKTPVET